jgi:hypothetical protein
VIISSRVPSERALLDSLYRGDIYLKSGSNSIRGIVQYARDCISRHSNGLNPSKIHHSLSVEAFVKFVAALKAEFTNSKLSHSFIGELAGELGLERASVIFHAPRIRVIPPSSFLSAGVSYNYKAHRDSWYGGVDCQVNFWAPIYEFSEEMGMWISPGHFNVPVPNSSSRWSVEYWMKSERWKAAANVSQETREHPVPTADFSLRDAVTIIPQCDEVMVFSGSHLHGSNRNTTDNVRFSLDFRLIFLPDLERGVGAMNVDNYCPDVLASRKDFFFANTLLPWGDDDKT